MYVDIAVVVTDGCMAFLFTPFSFTSYSVWLYLYYSFNYTCV